MESLPAANTPSTDATPDAQAPHQRLADTAFHSATKIFGRSVQASRGNAFAPAFSQGRRFIERPKFHHRCPALLFAPITPIKIFWIPARLLIALSTSFTRLIRSSAMLASKRLRRDKGGRTVVSPISRPQNSRPSLNRALSPRLLPARSPPGRRQPNPARRARQAIRAGSDTGGPRPLGMPHIGTGEHGDLVIAVTRAFSAP